MEKVEQDQGGVLYVIEQSVIRQKQIVGGCGTVSGEMDLPIGIAEEETEPVEISRRPFNRSELAEVLGYADVVLGYVTEDEMNEEVAMQKAAKGAKHNARVNIFSSYGVMALASESIGLMMIFSEEVHSPGMGAAGVAVGGLATWAGYKEYRRKAPVLIAEATERVQKKISFRLGLMTIRDIAKKQLSETTAEAE